MLKFFNDTEVKIDKDHLTNKEIFFNRNEVIVSKTDLKGKITYVNDVFVRVSDYTEQQLLDQPHSIIRHPEMPRCIFKLLWQHISIGKEVFAYVNNRTRNGDNYWVLAHVTPSFDVNGNIISYHSMRRSPNADTIKNTIKPLYQKLWAVEQAETSRKIGLEKSTLIIEDFIASQGVDYEEYILSL